MGYRSDSIITSRDIRHGATKSSWEASWQHSRDHFWEHPNLSAPKSHNRNRWRFPRWQSHIARNPAERRGFGFRNRSAKSQIASDFLSHPQFAMQPCFLLFRKSLAISGVCVGHRNRKSQKSLWFRCAKIPIPESTHHFSSFPCCGFPGKRQTIYTQLPLGSFEAIFRI